MSGVPRKTTFLRPPLSVLMLALPAAWKRVCRCWGKEDDVDVRTEATAMRWILQDVALDVLVEDTNACAPRMLRA